MKNKNSLENSSSFSDYVIAFKKITQEEKSLIQSVTARNLIDAAEKFIFENATIIKTKEEYDNNFLSQYSYKDIDTIEKIIEEDEYLEETYNDCIEKIEEGYYILETTIDFNDKGRQELFLYMNDGENFIILEGE